MDLILLAAGTSSRMGKQNKLLLDFNGKSIICRSCLNALRFLESLNEPSHLILVTGYRHLSIQKSIKECLRFIEQTSAPVKMTVALNRDYRKGQFSSVKTGVELTRSDFFISLGDMPLIGTAQYMKVLNALKGHEAARPQIGTKPGHPVLISSSLKEKILSQPDDSSMRKVLEKRDVNLIPVTDCAFITDCDTPEAYLELLKTSMIQLQPT